MDLHIDAVQVRWRVRMFQGDGDVCEVHSSAVGCRTQC